VWAYRPLVALTKVDEDEYDPAVSQDRLQSFTSLTTRRLMARLSRNLGVPPSNIFPVKNYCIEYAPNACPLVVHMLYHCLICADAFLEDECE
jgi:hypothetical protein